MGTPQAFWQTLLAATSKLSEVLVGTTALLDAIYTDVKPVETALGETINVPVPTSVLSQVNLATSGDPVFNEYTVNTVPIVFNKHLQYGAIVRNFDQFNSPESIIDVLIDPGIKAVAMQANAYVAALCNSTNLNVNSVVTTTVSNITPQQFITGGFNVLLNQLVNVWDSTSMAFVQAPSVYGNQLQAAAWTQESIAGINVAQQARIEGGIKVAYGARQMTDQQLLQTGTSGSYVYSSVYMSKFAIAAAFRPTPKGDTRVVDATYVYWKGIPIKIELGYNNLKGGYLLNIDAGMGVSVVRPEQAVLFSTSQ